MGYACLSFHDIAATDDFGIANHYHSVLEIFVHKLDGLGNPLALEVQHQDFPVAILASALDHSHRKIMLT